MPQNVEIKARLSQPENTKKKIIALADGPPTEIVQEDVFFHANSGRLKLRKFAPDAGELISYKRGDNLGPKTSTYHIFPTRNPDLLESMLTFSLGVKGLVRKVRQLYKIGQTRVHLDEVEELGSFLELEVVLTATQTELEGETIARSIMSDLAISPADLIDVAYIDLLDKK